MLVVTTVSARGGGRAEKSTWTSFLRPRRGKVRSSSRPSARMLDESDSGGMKGNFFFFFFVEIKWLTSVKWERERERMWKNGTFFYYYLRCKENLDN